MSFMWPDRKQWACFRPKRAQHQKQIKALHKIFTSTFVLWINFLKVVHSWPFCWEFFTLLELFTYLWLLNLSGTSRPGLDVLNLSGLLGNWCSIVKQCFLYTALMLKFEIWNLNYRAWENIYSHDILIPWGLIKREKIDIPTLLKVEIWNLTLQHFWCI